MSGFSFRAVAQQKAEARGRLLRAVAGMAELDAEQAEPEPPDFFSHRVDDAAGRRATPSLDGGARMDQPAPPVSHEETLVAIFEAERGRTRSWFQ